MFNNRKSRTSQLTFTCPKEDYGAVAEPIPAGRAIPEWYRKMPSVSERHLSAAQDANTVKRCVPVLDALTLGWVVPMAVTVRVEILGGLPSVGWNYPKTIISEHLDFQVAGTPYEGMQLMKYHNMWTIHTAPGWSCLVTPAMNRSEVFRCFSGVIDSDRLQAPVNFPFVLTVPDGVYTIERGTPMVQVIPFRRDDLVAPAAVRTDTPEEADMRVTHYRAALASNRWYAREVRAKRNRQEASNG